MDAQGGGGGVSFGVSLGHRAFQASGVMTVGVCQCLGGFVLSWGAKGTPDVGFRCRVEGVRRNLRRQLELSACDGSSLSICITASYAHEAGPNGLRPASNKGRFAQACSCFAASVDWSTSRVGGDGGLSKRRWLAPGTQTKKDPYNLHEAPSRFQTCGGCGANLRRPARLEGSHGFAVWRSCRVYG